jgi:hypothetical protein
VEIVRDHPTHLLIVPAPPGKKQPLRLQAMHLPAYSRSQQNHA